MKIIAILCCATLLLGACKIKEIKKTDELPPALTCTYPVGSSLFGSENLTHEDPFTVDQNSLASDTIVNANYKIVGTMFGTNFSFFKATFYFKDLPVQGTYSVATGKTLGNSDVIVVVEGYTRFILKTKGTLRILSEGNLANFQFCSLAMKDEFGTEQRSFSGQIRATL